jgi:hypothetical protein
MNSLWENLSHVMMADDGIEQLGWEDKPWKRFDGGILSVR